MKKLFAFTIFFSFLFVCFTAYGFCAKNKDVIEYKQNGHINWTTGIVRAMGLGDPLKKDSDNPSAYSAKALSEAKNNARHNLLEIVKEIRINSRGQVGKYAANSNTIMAQLKEIVYKAEEVEKIRKYMSDGTVEVYLQLSMYRGFAQLILPQEIKQIESVRQMAVGGGTTSSKSHEISPSKSYTGLVVDARNISVNPSIALRLLDEDGKEVYGAKFASREFAVQKGMSGYLKDINSAKKNSRVGNHPLSVKGLRTTGPGNSDIIISNADASILRSSSEHLAFLKKCKVIIVLN